MTIAERRARLESAKKILHDAFVNITEVAVSFEKEDSELYEELMGIADRLLMESVKKITDLIGKTMH